MDKKRINGWLNLVDLYLYLAPLAYVGSILMILAGMWLSGIFGFFYPSFIRHLAIMLIALVLIGYHINLLFKFSARQSTFPRRVVVALWLAPAYALLFLLWIGSLVIMYYFLFISLVVAVVGTIYMLRSQQVKNTFVN